MSQLQTQLLTDTWVTATWDEYIESVKQPEYAPAKCYYYNGSARLTESEVLPGLKFALLEEGLCRSRETDHTEIGSWFLEEVRQ